MYWFIKNISLIALAVLAVTAADDPVSEEAIAKQEYKNNLRKLCEKCARGHGGKIPAENFEFAVGIIFHREFNIIGHTAYFAHAQQQSLQHEFENDKLDEALFNRCNVSRKEDDKFNKELWDILSKCMETDDEKIFFQASVNMVKLISKYICDNSAERVKSVFLKGGLKCIDEKINEIMRCYLQTENLKTIFQLEYDDKFILDEKKCADILKFETCTMETLKSCNTTSAAEFVGGLFKIIKETMPCNFNNKTA